MDAVTPDQCSAGFVLHHDCDLEVGSVGWWKVFDPVVSSAIAVFEALRL